MKDNYWYWSKLLDKNKIEELCNFIEKNFDDYEGNHFDKDLKFVSTVKVILWHKVKHLLNDITTKCFATNRDNYGFNIWPILDSDYVNYNTYKKGNKYDWHKDSDTSLTQDTKFTILINLSTEKYKGGNLEHYSYGAYEIKELNDPGSVIMFPSYVYHRVTPITQGKRKTLAIFIRGPKFI
jgi:PKHD-type hydroxylase